MFIKRREQNTKVKTNNCGGHRNEIKWTYNLRGQKMIIDDYEG